MSCTVGTMTVDEWFETFGKDFKVGCIDRVRMLNDALQILRLDTYDLRKNLVIHEFTGSGDITMDLEYPMYKEEGRYTDSKCANASYVEDLGKSCDLCSLCEGKLYGLRMYYIGPSSDLYPCQYDFCHDGKQVKANIPSGIEKWFLRYYRGFELLESGDDIIPLPPSFYPALKMLLKIHYFELSGNMYEGDDIRSENRYLTFIGKLKEVQTNKLRRIERSALN